MSSETSPFSHPLKASPDISKSREHVELLFRIHRFGGRFELFLAILGHCWHRRERTRIQNCGGGRGNRQDLGTLVCALSRHESMSRWEARVAREKELGYSTTAEWFRPEEKISNTNDAGSGTQMRPEMGEGNNRPAIRAGD